MTSIYFLTLRRVRELLFGLYTPHNAGLYVSQWERASFTVRITQPSAILLLACLLRRKKMDSPILVMLARVHIGIVYVSFKVRINVMTFHMIVCERFSFLKLQAIELTRHGANLRKPIGCVG